MYPVYGGGTLAQFNDLPDGCDDEGVGPDIRGDGGWHHLAAVWDGKIIYLYIDGKETRVTPCAGELGTNVRDVYIGSRNGGERFLIATVDEVRIYNRALTPEEIALDMETSGLSVSPIEKMAVSWGKVKQQY